MLRSWRIADLTIHETDKPDAVNFEICGRSITLTEGQIRELNSLTESYNPYGDYIKFAEEPEKPEPKFVEEAEKAHATQALNDQSEAITGTRERKYTVPIAQMEEKAKSHIERENAARAAAQALGDQRETVLISPSDARALGLTIEDMEKGKPEAEMPSLGDIVRNTGISPKG